ncbi:MAG: hypothetical protein KC609_03245 [Myxococcales bacterium]|nr:hypothetical protein [Myxococcales bacterium]
MSARRSDARHRLLIGTLLAASLVACSPRGATRDALPKRTRSKLVDFSPARDLVFVGDDRLVRFDADGSLMLLTVTGAALRRRLPKAPINAVLFVAEAARAVVIDASGWLWQLRFRRPGGWRRMTPKPLFRAATHALIGPDRALYTIEGDGKMYRTDLRTLASAPIGNPGWERTRHFISCGTMLYTVEKVGALYRVNPTSGRWQRTGPFGAYSRVRHALCSASEVFTLESDGGVYVTSIPAGKRRKLLSHPLVIDTELATLVGRQLVLVNGRGRLLRLQLPK